MSQHELNTLLELKENPNLSQRSLSRKLKLSLGLTNSILKNLISRGWIKAKKDTGRKLLQETLHYYHHTKDLLTAYLLKLYQRGEKTVNIYGTGQLVNEFILHLTGRLEDWQTGRLFYL